MLKKMVMCKKYLSTIALFFIFGCICLVCLNGETIIKQDAGRGIYVKTVPRGAKVFIDGIERGVTPLTIENIVSGTHTILIKKDYYENWERKVSVAGGSRLYIAIDMVRTEQSDINTTNTSVQTTE
jgi:hypothetical protein